MVNLSQSFGGYAADTVEGPAPKKVVVDGYAIPVQTCEVTYRPHGHPNVKLEVAVKNVAITEEGIFIQTSANPDNIEKFLRLGGKQGSINPYTELRKKCEDLEETNKKLREENQKLHRASFMTKTSQPLMPAKDDSVLVKAFKEVMGPKK